MTSSVPSGGRSLRLVSRTLVHHVLVAVLTECLEARGLSGLELLRAQRAAMRVLSDRLRTQSRRVRGLTRAEFLAELEGSRAGFAREKGATESALAELVGAAPAAPSAPPQAVELLERRVAKMRRALEELEGRYQELARRAGEDPGLPSIHREVQGHAPERYREALKRVFELNVRLQGRQAA
jgi:hypothetical protein